MKAIVNPFLRKGSFLAACPPSEGVTFPCRLTRIADVMPAGTIAWVQDVETPE